MTIGYVFIEQEGLKTKLEFDYWINLSLEFNSKAKSSKKMKSKRIHLINMKSILKTQSPKIMWSVFGLL
jgi:hypothetical protein